MVVPTELVCLVVGSGERRWFLREPVFEGAMKDDAAVVGGGTN